jgi:sn-2 palmitoyl-lipid 9-desaturase
MTFSPTSVKIFITQIFSSLCILYTALFLDWSFILLMIFMYLLYGGFGIALTFHRTLAHKSWIFPNITKKILILIGALANVGSPLTWVAIHREHHRFSDTEKDPLSPKHKGFWHVMYGTMFDKPSLKYAPDFLRDEYCNLIHKNYYLIQLPVILLFLFVGGWKAVIAGHFAGGGLAWITSSLVNYFNHIHLGYQNFTTRDDSHNNIITGYLIFGEGWHNNHHHNPSEPGNKIKWWEFDFTFFIGNLLGTPNTRKD